MRRIDRIVVHCTATPPGREVSRKDLEQWHMVERGWDRLGYHWMVHRDGDIEPLEPESRVSYGAAGYNANSIHIVYVGGTDATGRAFDSRTMEQRVALNTYLDGLAARYPDAAVMGHRDLNPGKACPSYDVAADRTAWAAEQAIADAPPRWGEDMAEPPAPSFWARLWAWLAKVFTPKQEFPK